MDRCDAGLGSSIQFLERAGDHRDDDGGQGRIPTKLTYEAIM